MRLAGEKIGFVNSRALFFSLSLSLFSFARRSGRKFCRGINDFVQGLARARITTKYTIILLLVYRCSF